MKLTDRVYVVTGAGGGIGQGVTEALLQQGAGGVTMVDLTAPHRTAAVVDPGGDRTLDVAADVTSPEDAHRVVSATVERFGRLDGLVNCAGVVFLDTAWEAAVSDWNRQLEVNVTGSFVFSRAVGGHLRDHGGGAIVNVSSNCGKAGYPNMAAYNASKAAVLGLTRSLSMEWAADKINVNAVCPGGVETPMLAGVAEWLAPRLETPSAELLEQMGPAQLGRKIKPLEVGRVIAFLLSDDALIIRGQAISIDGGDTPY
ncbi:MAG: SDR family oxidoreductase [Acidimicrobiia bacterium]|nr:SDR family oxidoreductase [Acidimicrobiia bacterium]MYD04795.1 SDR family oxidoreductase [Acidimicrobiia bacterium]MYH55720.1 SDR family oxidoreductase [Acidimicrobiia bacterium]